jgi:malate dehydrogenase (oxaloacetate-decarboxylating)(NADP+)
VVCLAGFINALEITKRDVNKCKVVLNGAGAAGIACVKLMHAYGVPKENIVMCDTKGVIYKGRTEGMNKYKDEFATERPERTLQEAIKGADVFIGVSSGKLLNAEDIKTMNESPLIFAMANPVPEIDPEEARKGCAGAIYASGRSDYVNQINNVLCFPYIFRGTLDAGAREINDEMKMAVAKTLAQLAREPVTAEVQAAYGGRDFVFGPDYIIPTPFDSRLLPRISRAVVQAAMDSGVATI